MAKITDIRVVNNVSGKDGGIFEGIVISTDPPDHYVHALIESGCFCCEEYGFQICCNDEVMFDSSTDQKNHENILKIFKGQEIERVSFGSDRNDISVYYKQSLTVNVFTKDLKKLSLILYNEHNGYYPHNTRVKWHGINEDCTNEL